MKKCIVALLVFFLYAIGSSQAPDTSVTVHGKGTRGPYQLGFRYLINGSFSLFRGDKPISTDSFTVQFADGILDLTEPLPIGDSLFARFRFMPLTLKTRYFLHDIASSSADTSTIIDLKSTPGVEHFGSELSITGSKGFSFQAGQGVNNSLSQSLNLSIAGDLIPGLHTSAHISDKSTGTNGVTRRLEELDKIYIEAESDKFKGTFGDFDYTRDRDPLL
jgi:hypothetical protein